jgi:hypothetical protein
MVPGAACIKTLPWISRAGGKPYAHIPIFTFGKSDATALMIIQRERIEGICRTPDGHSGPIQISSGRARRTGRSGNANMRQILCEVVSCRTRVFALKTWSPREISCFSQERGDELLETGLTFTAMNRPPDSKSSLHHASCWLIYPDYPKRTTGYKALDP